MNTVIVAAAGDLDLATVGLLRQRLTETEQAGATAVVVDLSQVAHIDSTSIGVIISAYTRLRGRGHTLTLCGPLAPSVERVIDTLGIRRLIPVVEDVTCATGQW